MRLSIASYQLAKEWARSPEKTVVYIAATEKAARIFKSDLEFFVSGRANAEVCLFPAPDATPYTHLLTEPDIWIDRLKILYKLSRGERMAVVAPVEAVLRKNPPPWIFQKHSMTVRQGDVLDREEFLRFLTEAGYINQPLVEDEGAFSVRGSIVDIFTPMLDRPVRVEFDGDETASIRTFDPSTQKSSFSVSSFTIIPTRNVILSQETKNRSLAALKTLCDKNDVKTTERRELAESIQFGFYARSIETLMPIFYERPASFADYLPKDALVYQDDEVDINAAAEKFIGQVKNAYSTAKHIEKIVPPNELFDQTPSLSGRMLARDRSVMDGVFDSAMGEATAKIKRYHELGLKIIITCRTSTQADRLADLLRFHGFHAEATERGFAEIDGLRRGGVWIMLGGLSKGFTSESDRLAVLTEQDIFGAKTARRSFESKTVETFTDFSQIEEGDAIIHRDHGIGRYLGLKNMEVAGTKNDFLILEYLGGDKLYLPVWRINLISRYIGGGDAAPLDRLGGTRWTKTQAKVTAAIRTMALEILKTHAARKVHKGFAFSPRDQLLEEFEAAFPYDETPDQWRAIEETLLGMREEVPMDRLICGDVGYGKTEVAMRAAFKAIADKKQVAILVPTTVLAFQHYENFMARFENWPARIEMLSRFRSRTEQKHVVGELERGMVDIIIGTHRLLQRDIKFKDLGLLIIDEEHRFGVAHKERIRKLRSTVDTITMSATPIPRTLHMSLSGFREISIINTPPTNRLSIRTYVAEFDEGLIRGAIVAELARGGQVFFVHNRVETIVKMGERLARLIPEAKIAVGHGQMDDHELEDVMIRFLEKKANVLLCTTIIESGIDVPTANTIIINRADRMGLAQLYQLRGRVGRANVQAYAYLLTPEGDLPASAQSGGATRDLEPRISTSAKKRLALLQRYTELGSGFQIAMHDLEIRGAGNMLGAQQSGHINEIGYEMYMELLEKAIHRLQGKPEELKLDTEINLPIPAFIPTDYIEDEGQRLVLYRRLASADSDEEIDAIEKEMADRFGKIPELVKNLIKIVHIRVAAKGLAIESIQFDGKIFAYKFHPSTRVAPEKILSLVKSNPKKFAFKAPATLLVREPLKGEQQIFGEISGFLSLLPEAS